MKSSTDRLLAGLFIALVILGLLAFFKVPAYEKGVWYVLGALALAISNILSFKFGVHQATPPVTTTNNNPPAAPAQEEKIQ